MNDSAGGGQGRARAGRVLGRIVWLVGLPSRVLLIAAIRIYRVSLSGVLGGQCRFHPSCSAYAEEAIRSRGAAVGSALAVWRVLRCSPLSRGGVDLPPGGRHGTRLDPEYDGVIQPRAEATP